MKKRVLKDFAENYGQDWWVAIIIQLRRQDKIIAENSEIQQLKEEDKKESGK